jgi:hypothetical protein
MFDDFKDWLKWNISGRPYCHYTGYTCKCCGQWINGQFKLPLYKLKDDICEIYKDGKTSYMITLR